MQPVLGVWDFNVTRDIVRCNAAMADLFGLDPEKAARGLPLASYLASIHPQDAPRIEQRVAEAARALDIYSETYQVRDSRGEYRLILAQAAAYDSPEGVMFPGTLVAVTPRQLERLPDTIHPLDVIADHCPLARRLAEQDNLRVVKSLLDMTLEEVGNKLALALRTRLANW